ncbi:MAG: glycoside hydrolase family 3 protein [Caldilineaceae bacterium]
MSSVARRNFLLYSAQLAGAAILSSCRLIEMPSAIARSQTAQPAAGALAPSNPFAFTIRPTLPTPELSLAYKIGQMILIGFGGRYLDLQSSVVEQIGAGLVGGVVLFGRNVESAEQLQALTATLQGVSPLPLLISIDQEGGWVTRLSRTFGITSNYSAQYLGQHNDLALTRAQGESTAQHLASLGINLNLAPVVDLNTNPSNPIIGRYERSYSADPEIVTNHAHAVIEAHRRQNVYCTLKHFPGHGSSRGDTHAGFVDVTDTWRVTELAPYAALIGAQSCDVIMTAHIFNATLDPDYPATLSANVVTGLLREKLGYEGVVISDDMQMGAIAKLYDLETAVQLAITAGVDMIAYSNNIPLSRGAGADRLHAIITNLVERGIVTPQRIEQSYQRIVRLKQRLLNTIHTGL